MHDELEALRKERRELRQLLEQYAVVIVEDQLWPHYRCQICGETCSLFAGYTAIEHTCILSDSVCEDGQG